MRRLLALGACFVVLATARAQENVPAPPPAPEAATGTTSKGLVIAARHMVVAAHPLAAAAGREILRQGGSAIDAAIATQLVLGLVEPQSSGLGGGAFIVTWDAGARSVKTYDGRETAPSTAKPDRFLRDGKPMPFSNAVHSGLSVGVPGVMRAMELAHRQHGKLPWAALFAPAIKLAKDGFPIGERLNQLLSLENPDGFAPTARASFYEANGRAKAVGTILKNPEYAATLKVLAEKGAAVFYEGEIADAIVAAVANAPLAPGGLTRDDFASYQAKERDAVCFAYRTRKICGMGPPSSGMLTVGQTLMMLEPFAQIQGLAAQMTVPALHLIAEAEKLAYADRNKYIADPDVVAQPSGLLDPEYLALRRKLIDPDQAMQKAEPGMPPGLAQRTFGVDATHEAAGTSHISIIDDDGNAVAMTTTIESAFGSHLWAAGFLLNNELTDFSFIPVDKNGVAIANAVAGGKRPRSSMSPTLVLDAKGDLEIVTGSPGGSRIILFAVKNLIAMLDWGMDAQAAASLTNFGSEGGAFQIEPDLSSLWIWAGLKMYGHSVSWDAMTSGTHTIWRRGGHLEGGADPRKEGVALGD